MEYLGKCVELVDGIYSLCDVHSTKDEHFPNMRSHQNLHYSNRQPLSDTEAEKLINKSTLKQVFDKKRPVQTTWMLK